MTRKDSGAETDAAQTTWSALVALASHIKNLATDQTLDSRCASKLFKRLKKEVDAVEKRSSGTKAGREKLLKKFEDLDATLCDQGATLLMVANASLRANDASDAARERAPGTTPYRYSPQLRSSCE